MPEWLKTYLNWWDSQAENLTEMTLIDFIVSIPIALTPLILLFWFLGGFTRSRKCSGFKNPALKDGYVYIPSENIKPKDSKYFYFSLITEGEDKGKYSPGIAVTGMSHTTLKNREDEITDILKNGGEIVDFYMPTNDKA
jgi:hypothetical protein